MPPPPGSFPGLPVLPIPRACRGWTLRTARRTLLGFLPTQGRIAGLSSQTPGPQEGGACGTAYGHPGPELSLWVRSGPRGRGGGHWLCRRPCSREEMSQLDCRGGRGSAASGSEKSKMAKSRCTVRGFRRAFITTPHAMHRQHPSLKDEFSDEQRGFPEVPQ